MDDGFDDEELQLALALSQSLAEAEALGIPIIESDQEEKKRTRRYHPKKSTSSNQSSTPSKSPSRSSRDKAFLEDSSSSEDFNEVLSDSDEVEFEEAPRRIKRRSTPPKGRRVKRARATDDVSEGVEMEVSEPPATHETFDMDDIEVDHPLPKSDFSWKAMQVQLADDWAEKQKARLREGVPLETTAVMDTMPRSLQGLGAQWLHPPLRMKSLKTYNQTQKDALLAARKYMFQRIQQLSLQWHQQSGELPLTHVSNASFTGHQLAAVINALALPIRVEDIKLMLDPDNAGLGEQETKAIEKENFKSQFISQLRNATWPRESLPASEAPGKDEFKRSQLPAFSPSAPPEFHKIVTWEEFCHIFDLVNLKCEKSGKVW